jgi:hypothetical protein
MWGLFLGVWFVGSVLLSVFVGRVIDKMGK